MSPTAKKPEKSKEGTKASTPKAKTAAAEKSPEIKPAIGQAKKDDKVKAVSKDDGKTLKVQSAGAGQAGSDYNPSKKNYHPINDAFWKHGDK